MCRRKDAENRYIYEVNNRNDYEYIRAYFKGDTLLNGNIVGNNPYIQIKHKYCGSVYEIQSKSFIAGNECPICCKVYENSFAYHIEVELGLNINDVWDFDKNTLNPYHIWRSGTEKVWIKCQEKDYHESYETSCNNFYKGKRCVYCSNRKVHKNDSFGQWLKDNNLFHLWSKENKEDPFSIARCSISNIIMYCDIFDHHNDYGGYKTNCISFVRGRRCNYCNSRKVHPKDSFGQWLKDNNLFNLWSSKNDVDPFTISKSNNTKIWMLCDKHDYHNDYEGYEVSCANFISGYRCPYCKGVKVHPYDSFGYHNFDKVLSWHPDNDISPFRVSRGNGMKYKFICHECNHIWSARIYSTSKGHWCPSCSKSKGENRIKSWLDKNNISYNEEKEYDGLVGVGGGKLRYDFYLPDHNLLIEFDGKQHYKWIEFMMTRDEFLSLNKHDFIKDEYALTNKIRLLRIKYDDFNNIEKILIENL